MWFLSFFISHYKRKRNGFRGCKVYIFYGSLSRFPEYHCCIIYRILDRRRDCFHTNHMEKKEIYRRNYSVWSIFSIRDNSKLAGRPTIYRKIFQPLFSTLETPIESVQAGFTLIELIIVIGILGVLVAAVLVLVNPLTQIRRARDAQRKNDLHQIQIALEQYYNDHGSYPVYCDNTTVYSANSQPWISQLTSSYINSLPTDPLNTWGSWTQSTVFVYQYQAKQCTPCSGGSCTSSSYSCSACDNTGQHYVLGAHFENAKDVQINWNFTDYWGGWFINYVVTK